MKVSVLIPAHNCARTIRETIDSVLRQSVPVAEILVMDDGSTDETAAVLSSYGERIQVFRQANAGPSLSRNVLVSKTKGDLIAFLDSDDILHPKYTETQLRLFRKHENAAAYFVGHVNFQGMAVPEWPSEGKEADEVMPALDFFKRFNQNPAPFASCSFFSVPKRILNRMGAEVFKADGAEDFYCCARLSLLGNVVYDPAALVAYRVTDGSHSTNRVRGLAARVHAFELLEDRFKALSDPAWLKAFDIAFASHRRSYAKYLLGSGNMADGRKQLWQSVRTALRPLSMVKSLGILGSTYLPRKFQPQWPAAYQR